MKTLRVLALAMLAGSAVAACSMHGPTADPAEVADRAVDPDDGTWCGTPGATGPVYINITYADDGAAREGYCWRRMMIAGSVTTPLAAMP